MGEIEKAIKTLDYIRTKDEKRFKEKIREILLETEKDSIHYSLKNKSKNSFDKRFEKIYSILESIKSDIRLNSIEEKNDEYLFYTINYNGTELLTVCLIYSGNLSRVARGISIYNKYEDVYNYNIGRDYAFLRARFAMAEGVNTCATRIHTHIEAGNLIHKLFNTKYKAECNPILTDYEKNKIL